MCGYLFGGRLSNRESFEVKEPEVLLFEKVSFGVGFSSFEQDGRVLMLLYVL